MKKKSKAWAVLPLAALLLACGAPSTSSTSSAAPTPSSSATSSSSVAPTPSSSETSTPSSSQAPTPSSSDTSAPSSSEAPTPEVITHLDAYTGVAAGAELRDFDERFDTKVDDFSGETINGTTDGVRHNGILRALVDSELDNFPKTTDGAIYKAAAGTYEAMNFGANGIGFKIRVSRGKLALKNLRLELRGGDAFQTYPIQLADARDGDNEALPELTGAFQDIVINPGQTIEDENTVYKNTDGTDSTTTVLGHILGFHLVANDVEVGAEIEIAQVFTFSGTNRVVLDDFNREDVAQVPDAWWGGSASGFIVRRGVTLSAGKKYITPALAEHTHLVVSALGDASGLSLIGLDAQDTVLATIKWTEALSDEANLPALATGAYANYLIKLSQLAGNGILAKVKLVATTGVEISNVFLTSLQEPQLDLAYPYVTPTVILDSFTQDVASLNDDWDASAASQVNIDAGRTGFVSYAMGDQISVSNGALNLPVAEGYAQVTIGYQATHLDTRAKYVVIAAKGDDLNLLRFKFRGQGSNQEVWFNAALAAEGVKTYGDQNAPSPYVDANGFTHYVIDLALNKLGVGDLFDLYYTGASPVQIESIYFAVDDLPLNPVTEADPAPESVGNLDLAGYHYVGGMAISPTNMFGLRIASATEGATFVSFRVTMGGTDKWLKDDAISAFYKDGRRVLATDAIPAEGCEIFFDLSVYPEDAENYIHAHIGGLEGIQGTIVITKLLAMAHGFVKDLGSIAPAAVTPAYNYIGKVVADATYEYLMITLKATGTNMTYESFRLESPSGTFAFANNPDTFSALHADGTAVVAADVIPEAGETILLDLTKSAISTAKGGDIHVHYSGWGDPSGTLTIESIAGCSGRTPYEVILANLPK